MINDLEFSVNYMTNVAYYILKQKLNFNPAVNSKIRLHIFKYLSAFIKTNYNSLPTKDLIEMLVSGCDGK